MDIKAIKRKVFKQLVEGNDLATQLQLLLSKPFHYHAGHADELVAKILGYFDKTISDLGSYEPVPVAVPVEGTSRDTSSGDSPVAEYGRCEDSGDSRKRPLGVNKGKRGCYKRKRKSQSWTVESNTLEDTHAWRKYGQKGILNAKYPRSYFRCTHKYTQGCNAAKQVQKLEQDPKMFQITYIGNHTCNADEESLNKMEESSETVIDSETARGSCILIRHCEDKVITSEIDQSKDEISSRTVAETVKEEETKVNEYDLSLVWQDFMAFEEHELMYCRDDQTSSSSRGVDMDEYMVLGSCDFGNETDAYYCI